MNATAAQDFIRSRFTETATADEVLAGIDLTGKTAIVTGSSGAHCTSDIHLDDLNFARRPYERFDGYAHAKTAANLLTVGFNRRFADKGVTCNAVTPSAVQTNLGRRVTISRMPSTWAG